jgi:sigma-B regulation protein RsbU (phosphoserine phosphatase)
MWNIKSTIQMMRAMSLSANANELGQVVANHMRQTTSVDRVMVINQPDIGAPWYCVTRCIDWDEQQGQFVESHPNDIRKGGLLAQLLYTGELHLIADLSIETNEPAGDLLHGRKALMAFPLFDKGHATGSVILLSTEPQVCRPSEVCRLAVISGLFDRAFQAHNLVHQLELTCNALDRELASAADVQRWLLPASLPAVAGVSIAASYRTAKQSGGDYYDVIELPDGRLGFLIADVSGKGAPAAVLMAVVRTIVHETARSRVTGPATLLDYADTRLCTLGLPQRGAFTTAFSCAMDPATGTLTYSSAGHNPPRLLRVRQRTVLPLDGAGATPLGMLDKPCTHTEETVVLMPGDLAVLYTDGLTEAMSPEGEFFGTARLDEILRSLPEPVTPALAVEAVARAVSEFTGAGSLSDDQTLLVLGRRDPAEEIKF